MRKKTNKFFEGLSLYRFMICMGLFMLFVAYVTLLIQRGVTNKRYEIGLKQSLFILSEAMVYVSAQPLGETDGNDIYYWYLIDALNKNFISALLFKAGEDIVIGGKLFRINIPVARDEPLLVTVDTNGGGMKPNRLGYDVFVFQVIDKKLRAMGAKETLYPVENYGFYCNHGSTSKDELLGVNCTYQALIDYKYFSKLK